MAEADLETAADEIAGEFTELDPLSVVVTGSGIGLGVFTGEFFAELVGNQFGGGSARRRNLVEIVTKLGVAGGHIALRSVIGSPLLGVLLAMGAAGAAGTAILQILEVAISAIQTGGVTATRPQPDSTSTASTSASVTDSGYGGGGAAQVSV